MTCRSFLRLAFLSAMWVIAPWATTAVTAQSLLFDNADWKETEAPPPPAFDVNKLVTFELARASSMVYGIDPAAMFLSKEDGVLRYVMVVTSPAGVRNVSYEAIRCATAEFKVYARYSGGKWNEVKEPQWRPLSSSMPSAYPFQFAKAGACDGAAPRFSVKEVLQSLNKSTAVGVPY